MKHVFKAGSGAWSKDGIKFDCRCINDEKAYLNNGWSLTLDEALSKQANNYTPVETKDEEAELREQIKKLGGKPGGRSSIKKLRKQLEGLQNGNKKN